MYNNSSLLKYILVSVCLMMIDDFDDDDNTLTWEDTYAITQELRKRHGDLDLEGVSLRMIYEWTTQLPQFRDDRELANENILNAIFQEWYEEVNAL